MSIRHRRSKETTRDSLAHHVQILELRAELDNVSMEERTEKPKTSGYSLLYLIGVATLMLGGVLEAFSIAGVGVLLSTLAFMGTMVGVSRADEQHKKQRLNAVLKKVCLMDSPATVPLLLLMVNRYYDDAISVSVWRVLDSLLPRVTEEHLPYFTKASVTRLNSYLNRSEGRQTCLHPIAVVRCLEVVGNEESVQAMQVALHAEPYLRGRDWEGLCEVIQEVLPRLRLRLKTVREEQSLLRPSQAPDEKALLLRPSHESTVPAEELLRSASKKGEG